MILELVGAIAVLGGGYYGYTKLSSYQQELKAKVAPVVATVSADVAKVETTVSDVKADVVTAVNAVESVTKSL